MLPDLDSQGTSRIGLEESRESKGVRVEKLGVKLRVQQVRTKCIVLGRFMAMPVGP